jgi:hypothetical protein
MSQEGELGRGKNEAKGVRGQAQRGRSGVMKGATRGKRAREETKSEREAGGKTPHTREDARGEVRSM